MSDDQALLDLAVSTARAAGALVVEGRRGQVRVAGTKSSPTDVVTDNDVASEQLIRSTLLAARPGDGFVGEEGDSLAGTSGVRWVVDPIDGTVNYLYGIPQYAVSIAAQRDGQTVAGVVLEPVSGETFTALRGSGSWLDREPITVSATTRLSHTLLGTGFHYRADVREHQAAELARLLPRIRDVRRLGSAALDLCYVGCGRLDAYVERGLRPWDLAAAQLVVEEAGGCVEGLAHDPPSELLALAAPPALVEPLRTELLACGFGDWPMPQWPPVRTEGTG